MHYSTKNKHLVIVIKATDLSVIDEHTLSLFSIVDRDALISLYDKQEAEAFVDTNTTTVKQIQLFSFK